MENNNSVDNLIDNNINENNNDITNKDLLDLYWKYLELQSSQRNQTCIWYFTILTALIGFLVSLIGFADRLTNINLALSCIAVLIILATVVFWILFNLSNDMRNKARVYLQSIVEKNISDEKMRPFSYEQQPTSLTYTKVLKLQFCIVIFLSLIFLFHVIM